MGVILEPEVGEEALHYHHGNTHKEGIGDAEFRLEDVYKRQTLRFIPMHSLPE